MLWPWRIAYVIWQVVRASMEDVDGLLDSFHVRLLGKIIGGFSLCLRGALSLRLASP